MHPTKKEKVKRLVWDLSSPLPLHAAPFFLYALFNCFWVISFLFFFGFLFFSPAFFVCLRSHCIVPSSFFSPLLNLVFFVPVLLPYIYKYQLQLSKKRKIEKYTPKDRPHGTSMRSAKWGPPGH